jgi:glycosyltransferase involved in cell wall biosynthesis
MKVAYFIDNLRGDGTQRVLMQLIQGLAKRGHEQSVICLNDSYDQALLDELRSTPVNVRVVGKQALVCGYGLLSTWSWLWHEKFDAVVTMLFAADTIGRLLARWSGVPRVVSSLRSRNIHYSRIQRWLVRATVGVADAVIINSPHTREFAVKFEGVRPESIVYIPNGMQVGDYWESIDFESLRNELGVPRNGLLLGTVGRLTEQKGIDILLHALSHLNSYEAHLVVVGAGEMETKLRALTARLGLESRVHFIGYRADVPRLLGVFDLYVHPARFEGMPNALLEAMATARPIVATQVDGNRELIEDGVHGWLVPPENPDALATAVAAALRDRDEARRRGIAARQRVADHFSLDAMITAWEKVLTEKDTSI